MSADDSADSEHSPDLDDSQDDFTFDDYDGEEEFLSQTVGFDDLSFHMEQPGDQLSPKERESVVRHLERIPQISPKELEQRLLSHGYRGQALARRAGSILAYRHLQRLRREFIDDDPTSKRLSNRENYLFLGATGTGKTFLVEILFREILGVPTIIADMTRFSESGYVGDDVQMLLSQLYEVAGQDRGWASCGVVCLDEFDKLAASRSSARFAGEGTTKDVSGFGVQRGLLTLLSGSTSPFPTDFGYSSHGARIAMPLSNIMFIACGAFSGLKETADLSSRNVRIGFEGKPKTESNDAMVSRIGLELLENTRAFSDYGILPELTGRFSRLVPFNPLEPDVLKTILEDNVVASYRHEFSREGVELIITDAAVTHIIDAALRRETGARGLRASLVPHLEEAAYETFGEGNAAKAILDVQNGEIGLKIEMSR